MRNVRRKNTVQFRKEGMVIDMKKFLAILGMSACMLSLAACGAKEETDTLTESEEQMLIEAREADVAVMHQIISSGAEAQYEKSDVIYSGLLSLKDAMDEIGEYVGTSGGTVTVDDEEIVVNVNLDGTSHDAIVEMVYNLDDEDYSSIAVNVSYSVGENMERAVLNTILGMGTVFIVLILISLIISAFNLIPIIQAKFSKNKKEAEAPAQSSQPAAAIVTENEELSDDLELTAVIAAAVAAYEGQSSTDGFVVRSIRKARR